MRKGGFSAGRLTVKIVKETVTTILIKCVMDNRDPKGTRVQRRKQQMLSEGFLEEADLMTNPEARQN